MKQEQYYKAKILQEEIEKLQRLLGDDFRHITTVTSYNHNVVQGKYYTREFQISKDLSTDITYVIKDRLTKLQIEMEKL